MHHVAIFIAFVSALAFAFALAGVMKPILPRCDALVVKFGACVEAR